MLCAWLWTVNEMLNPLMQFLKLWLHSFRRWWIFAVIFNRLLLQYLTEKTPVCPQMSILMFDNFWFVRRIYFFSQNSLCASKRSVWLVNASLSPCKLSRPLWLQLRVRQGSRADEWQTDRRQIEKRDAGGPWAEKRRTSRTVHATFSDHS